MATTPTLLSIEEYLRTSYKPDVDFVDGEIEERNMGEFQHARIQNLIAFFLTLNEKSWSTQTIVEQRIRVAARRVRICDVAVLRADAPREQVTTTPPLICIEILSPEDRIPRATRVLADYLAMAGRPRQPRGFYLRCDRPAPRRPHQPAGTRHADPPRSD